MDDKRPVWDFTGMSESDFRTLFTFGMITGVKSKWAYTSLDTAEEWLEVSNDKRVIRLPKNWKTAMEFVGYSSSPGLFKFTYFGEKMEEKLKLIDKWEAKYERERRDYERLKAKFEPQG